MLNVKLSKQRASKYIFKYNRIKSLIKINEKIEEILRLNRKMGKSNEYKFAEE